MGIFDRIFKREEKKEKEPPTSCSMGLDDVDTWIKEGSKERQEALVSQMRPAIDEILQLRDAAREVVEEIRDHKPPPEIKKRMFKPVLTAKPNYVKGMLDGLANIRPPVNDTYDALVEANAQVAKALKIIHKTQLSHGHIIAMFFQEEIPRLGSVLNRVIDLRKSVEEDIEKGSKEEKRAAGVGTATAELRKAMEAKRRLKDETATAQDEINALEAKRAKYEEELKGLREGAAYRKLADIKGELAHVHERLATVEGRGRNLLGPLLRVLRKYARAAADKGTRKVIDPYIKNPQATFFEEAEGAVVITRILNEVYAMADRGELALDKKEREKVDRAMANLSAIKQEHETIKKEEQRLKDALASSSVREEEAATTTEIRREEEDIKRLYAQLESANSGAKEKEREVERLKDQLEKEMSKERGTDVTIEI